MGNSWQDLDWSNPLLLYAVLQEWILSYSKYSSRNCQRNDSGQLNYLFITSDFIFFILSILYFLLFSERNTWATGFITIVVSWTWTLLSLVFGCKSFLTAQFSSWMYFSYFCLVGAWAWKIINIGDTFWLKSKDCRIMLLLRGGAIISWSGSLRNSLFNSFLMSKNTVLGWFLDRGRTIIIRGRIPTNLHLISWLFSQSRYTSKHL